MNSQNLEDINKLISDISTLKWMFYIELSLFFLVIVFYCIMFFVVIYVFLNMIASYYMEIVRPKYKLRNNEYLILRFKNFGDYYDEEPYSVVCSRFTFIADKLLRAKSKFLKKYCLRRLKRNQNQLYPRLFLAFFYIENNKKYKSIDILHKIKRIDRFWHREFINQLIVAIESNNIYENDYTNVVFLNFKK